MDCKEVFGKQFRKARDELGLSQGEVAKALGVGRTVISSWENGHSSPLLERLDEISVVLKQPIGFFFESGGRAKSFDTTNEELFRLSVYAFGHVKALQEKCDEIQVALGYIGDVIWAVLERTAPGDHHLVKAAKEHFAKPEEERQNKVSEEFYKALLEDEPILNEVAKSIGSSNSLASALGALHNYMVAGVRQSSITDSYKGELGELAHFEKWKYEREAYLARNVMPRIADWVRKSGPVIPRDELIAFSSSLIEDLVSENDFTGSFDEEVRPMRTELK